MLGAIKGTSDSGLAFGLSICTVVMLKFNSFFEEVGE
jgi:hypothetical protein